MNEICQSCGTPLNSNEDRGTEKNKQPSADYCCHCYQKGKFTDPKITVWEMMEKVEGFLTRELDFSKEEADQTVQDTIPQLKRWKK